MKSVRPSNGNSQQVSHTTSSTTVAAALQRLPPALRELNHTYIDHVARRSLLTATQASNWLDTDVTVFLRHDKVAVFAIVAGDEVAMADYVTLVDVKYHVDAQGRAQSNVEQGPLPNKRTVHAYLTGRLTAMSESGQRPDPKLWTAVVYHPLQNDSFVFGARSTPIYSSAEVRMVPGRFKVWCPNPGEPAA